MPVQSACGNLENPLLCRPICEVLDRAGQEFGNLETARHNILLRSNDLAARDDNTNIVTVDCHNRRNVETSSTTAA